MLENDDARYGVSCKVLFRPEGSGRPVDMGLRDIAVTSAVLDSNVWGEGRTQELRFCFRTRNCIFECKFEVSAQSQDRGPSLTTLL